MSTKDVADHHLESLLAGDLEETMKDYDDTSVFISPNGVARGREEITAVFTRLLSTIFAPGTYTLTVDFDHVEGDVAMIMWHADCQGVTIPLGTDTMIIRDGVILTQTVAVKVVPTA
jgi:ketosteroid isomerase-like protein